MTGDATQDRESLLSVVIAFSIASTIVWLARLYVAIVPHHNRPIGLDDVFFLLGYILSMGYSATVLLSLHYGMGKTIAEVTTTELMNEVKASIAQEWTFGFATYFTKMSCFFLYLRVRHDPSSWFTILTYLGIIVLTVNQVIGVIVFLTMCIPYSKNWNFYQPGHCINQNAYLLFYSIFCIVSDIYMVLLPIPTLAKVHRSLRQRLLLVFLFTIGFIATIASGVRLQTIMRYAAAADRLQAAAPTSTWSCIEVNLSLACASAPALRALLTTLQEDRSKRTDSSSASPSFNSAATLRYNSNTQPKHQDMELPVIGRSSLRDLWARTTVREPRLSAISELAESFANNSQEELRDTHERRAGDIEMGFYKTSSGHSIGITKQTTKVSEEES